MDENKDYDWEAHVVLKTEHAQMLAWTKALEENIWKKVLERIKRAVENAADAGKSSVSLFVDIERTKRT